MPSACCIALGACANLTVRTDQNPNLSVAQCHTYSFAKEYVANADQPAAYGNPLNADRLRAAIEANLSSRGIQPADRAAADCVVGYALGSRQVMNDYYGGIGPGWGPGWGYGWGFGGGYYGGAFGWDYPYMQNETRIAVDVFDAKSHQAIWHASVSQTVSELSGPNAVEKINAAAAAIFSKFPAGAPPAAGRAT
ncbi:MAG: DUF4136 domain-containing protein [Steroidobacteraceae bacterium]